MLTERLDQDAEEVSEDAAAAMLTFCVCQSLYWSAKCCLFETCCTILCQDPVNLQERAGETKEGLEGSTLEVGLLLAPRSTTAFVQERPAHGAMSFD